jgi:FdhE protein
VTLDDWIRAHAFLRPLADFHARVDAAIAAVQPACPEPPDWQTYAADFAAGIPLLESAAAGVDLGPLENAVADVTERVSGGAGAADPGLIRCVGWLTIGASLKPLLREFDAWRDDDRWMRSACPACGARPAMAQLAGVEPGRQRFLVCGCCATRWRYLRTTCPFCEAAPHRLASLGIDGEGGLRIDYCESCRGYLKTYNGQGSEGVLLADWTSLHLDIAAAGRGWRRAATSLYSLDIGGLQPPVFRSNSGGAEDAPDAGSAATA